MHLTEHYSIEEILEENPLKFIKKKYKDEESIYQIVRYKKDQLDNTTDKFRSVIFNENEKKCVCFSPMKSVSFNLFSTEYFINNKIIIEEFVEGTMINLFFDNNKWEIATRSSIGGNIKFHQEKEGKTFKEMFEEVKEYVKLDFDKLEKKYCYSFVLQHPENRIVKAFTEKKLYLISIYEIKHLENKEIHIDEMDKGTKKLHMEGTNVTFPEIQSQYQDYSSLVQDCSQGMLSYSIMGFVLKTETGIRSKVRNISFEEVRRLRGNHAKHQYLYLILRKDGTLKKYLDFYPEDGKVFENYRTQIYNFLQSLYLNYSRCYKRKEKVLLEFPFQFRQLMFELHHEYFSKKKPEPIKFFDVKALFHTLHPAKQMFLLNYEHRNFAQDHAKEKVCVAQMKE